MNSYARWLFGAAAVSNIAIGLALILLRPHLQSQIGVEVLGPTGQMFCNLTGLLIMLMGWVYGLIAADAVRYRPFILIGIVGKLLAAGFIIAPKLGEPIPVALPPLIVGDAVYALLFLHYLWTTRSKAE